jgi:type VI secretion system protein
MVSVSLLQRLEGDHVRSAGPSGHFDETAVTDSILADMRVLLNSRQGCCESRTDYGLMDFEAAAENYRNAITMIARDVEKQIRLFEPRLRNVMVRGLEDKTRPLEVVFHVTAELAYKDRTVKVRFDSVLGSDGHMRFTR